MPYGGDLITGLTNLLDEVVMPQLINTARNPSAPETKASEAYPALKNSIHTISLPPRQLAYRSHRRQYM